MLDYLEKLATQLLVADMQREAKEHPEGNFELEISFNEDEPTLILERLIPDKFDCRASATKRKVIREIEINPCNSVKEVINEIVITISNIIPEIEINLENSKINFYFPESE